MSSNIEEENKEIEIDVFYNGLRYTTCGKTVVRY